MPHFSSLHCRILSQVDALTRRRVLGPGDKTKQARMQITTTQGWLPTSLSRKVDWPAPGRTANPSLIKTKPTELIVASAQQSLSNRGKLCFSK